MKTIARAVAIRWVLSATPLLALGACGGPSPEIESVASELTSVEYHDPSGSIHVRVKTCDTTPSAFTNCAYCLVDDGWARVGGGAEIIGESASGAMLQASFPSKEFFSRANAYGCKGPAGHSPPVLGIDDNAAWVTRASGANHQLRAYIIEMQVSDGPNGARTKPYTSESRDYVVTGVNPPTSYSVEYPESDLATAPNSGWPEILVGGGAQIFRTDGIGDEDITTPTNAYLVESEPIDGANGRAWRSTARAQSANQPEAMKTYVIGIEPCSPAMAPYCFLSYVQMASTVANATAGYGTAAHTVGSPFVVTAVGGLAAASSGGVRYLADEIPLNGRNNGFTIRSKAGAVAQSGQTTGRALALQSGITSYNAVRFLNSNAMYRPSGTNPVLQQSTLYPDAPALRWYLEVLGGGLYRLRNGNPGSSSVAGTDCAYQDGTTSNIRVKACGTGNEFKWKWLVSGSAYSGQLVNVGSNKCIDTNGQSGNGNLTLKTCVSDSGAQYVWLDVFGWPPTP